MRISNHDLERIREIENLLARIDLDDPDDLRWSIRALHEALDTQQTSCYGLAPRGDGVTVEFFVGFKMRPRYGEILDTWLESKGLRWGVYDSSCPEPRQRNVVLDLPRLRAVVGARAVRTNPAVLELFPKLGIVGLEQLRVLVCDGPTLLGWVGAHQPGHYTDRQRHVLARLVPAFARRFEADRALRTHASVRSALDAAMEAIGAAAFVTDTRGSMVHANAAGAERFARRRSQTLDLLRGAMARPAQRRSGHARATTRESIHERTAERAKVTRFRERGVGERALVILEEGSGRACAIVASAARRRGLSTRQTIVLQHLATGASNIAIADALAIKVRTVEAHVTAILERFAVTTRSQLIACLFSGRDRFW